MMNNPHGNYQKKHHLALYRQSVFVLLSEPYSLLIQDSTILVKTFSEILSNAALL